MSAHLPNKIGYTKKPRGQQSRHLSRHVYKKFHPPCIPSARSRPMMRRAENLTRRSSLFRLRRLRSDTSLVYPTLHYLMREPPDQVPWYIETPSIRPARSHPNRQPEKRPSYEPPTDTYRIEGTTLRSKSSAELFVSCSTCRPSAVVEATFRRTAVPYSMVPEVRSPQ